MTEEKIVLKLFVRKNDKESVVVKRILRRNGTPFNEIDVGKNDATAYLWRDFGTDEVPVLVSSSGKIIGGAKKIQKFIERRAGKI